MIMLSHEHRIPKIESSVSAIFGRGLEDRVSSGMSGRGYLLNGIRAMTEPLIAVSIRG